jgi:hypothetical protein
LRKINRHVRADKSRGRRIRKPMKMPRRYGFQDRHHSSRVMNSKPRLGWITVSRRSRHPLLPADSPPMTSACVE